MRLSWRIRDGMAGLSLPKRIFRKPYRRARGSKWRRASFRDRRNVTRAGRHTSYMTGEHVVSVKRRRELVFTPIGTHIQRMRR